MLMVCRPTQPKPFTIFGMFSYFGPGYPTQVENIEKSLSAMSVSGKATDGLVYSQKADGSTLEPPMGVNPVGQYYKVKSLLAHNSFSITN